ncbi:hypothetical protein [Paenibacillus thailandensis]|uniref:DUF3828 domain-containing protein n=1 Tax=Paenibacillus thailandensis TaxID=393250 RepID=A0ABW5QZ48_9BACL
MINSLDYAYNQTINSLVKSYYDQDIPADQLFTLDANPYGSPDDLYTPDTTLAQVLDTKIDRIKYSSVSEAIVRTSQISTTPAVRRNRELELHFRKEGDMWKINKVNSIHFQNTLLDDVDEKAAALIQNSPDEVEKLLSDLRANYDAGPPPPKMTY